MSKTETMRQSAAASNEKRLAHLARQVESVRQSKVQSVEDLAALLEPLAQAMAALTDETLQTLALIEQRTREQSEVFGSQLHDEIRAFREISARAAKAAEQMRRSTQTLRWRQAALAVATGALAAVLVSGLWRWLEPPMVTSVTLDPQAVANLLQPPLSAACRPSAGS